MVNLPIRLSNIASTYWLCQISTSTRGSRKEVSSYSSFRTRAGRSAVPKTGPSRKCRILQKNVEPAQMDRKWRAEQQLEAVCADTKNFLLNSHELWAHVSEGQVQVPRGMASPYDDIECTCEPARQDGNPNLWNFRVRDRWRRQHLGKRGKMPVYPPNNNSGGDKANRQAPDEVLVRTKRL